MRSKIFAAVAAGGLLVGAGLVTSIVSSPGVANAQDETEAPDEMRPERVGGRGILDEVLDDLVAEGTLTQEQADAVARAAEEKVEELRDLWRQHLGDLSEDELREGAPFPLWRGFGHGFRLRGLLDDGGIDQGEYDGLRDTHPLKQVDVSEYLEDGLITPEEVREIFSDLKGSFGDDA
jgi:hypothetical protein